MRYVLHIKHPGSPLRTVEFHQREIALSGAKFHGVNNINADVTLTDRFYNRTVYRKRAGQSHQQSPWKLAS